MIQKLIKQKNLSIYITDDLIRITEGKKTGYNIYVSKALSTPTPAGCFDDGLITDVGKVATAITEVLGKKDMSKSNLYFTVYSRKIAAKEIEMPYMKKLEVIEAMINSSVDDYFPMSNMDDYITRFTVLDTVEREGRKNYSIVVYAVLKDLVSSYMELAKALKMPLASIDYQVNSLYNLVKRQSRQSTALFLQIDDDVTHISIFRGPSQLFRRSVPYGVDTLAGAFASAKELEIKEARAILINDKKIDENEASRHKTVAALREQKSGVWLDEYLTSDEYQDLMQDYIASITRVINFFISKNSEVVLDNVKVIGTGVRISHLDKTLENVLGLPINMVKRLYNVHIQKEKGLARLTDDDLNDFLPNIGALIHPLNLRLAEEAGFTKGGIGYGLIFFLLALAIAGTGGGTGFVYWQNSNIQRERDFLLRYNESLKNAEDYHNYYLGAQTFVDELIAYDAGTQNDNEALLLLIETLEEVLPSSIRLNELAVDNGKVSFSAISLGGKEAVARFIMELKKQDFIDEIFVSDINDTYDSYGRRILSQFSMVFSISIPEDSEDTEEESEGGV